VPRLQCRHRRPPPLELLDRLELLLDRLEDELEDDDEDGRETPCDGLLDRLVAEPLELLELDEPEFVEGAVEDDEPEPDVPEL